MPRLTRKLHAEMMADYAAGVPVTTIAAKYQVHQTAPGKAAKRAGMAMRQQPPTESRAAKRRWQVANPEKRKAHKAVERALADGSLVQKPCEKCGDPNSQAHHEDYSKPLEVNWLCQKDHKARHTELKKATSASTVAKSQ